MRPPVPALLAVSQNALRRQIRRSLTKPQQTEVSGRIGGIEKKLTQFRPVAASRLGLYGKDCRTEGHLITTGLVASAGLLCFIHGHDLDQKCKKDPIHLV